MRSASCMIFAFACVMAASFAAAQPPGFGPQRTPGQAGADLVARMMELDKDKDGKLTKSEITDERLHRLFDRADANKDQVVTKDELVALEAKERPQNPGGRPGFAGQPGGGPGGFMMGFPRPGEILPPMVQQRLGLNSEQKRQLADLQKEVDGKLGTILTDEQNKLLKEMRERGPGRFGPPGGGPGRFGPPGGGPRPSGRWSSPRGVRTRGWRTSRVSPQRRAIPSWLRSTSVSTGRSSQGIDRSSGRIRLPRKARPATSGFAFTICHRGGRARLRTLGAQPRLAR